MRRIRRYLLDSDAVSDLIRHPTGDVAKLVERAGPETICTSIVVACELRFGAAKRASAALSARVDKVLESLQVEALAYGTDREYARIRADLERAGQPIGANDLMIAAHAVALDCTLVTGNHREFGRVKGLRVHAIG